MRVLHVCLASGWGGMEAYPLSIAEAAARRGIVSLCVAKKGTVSEQRYLETLGNWTIDRAADGGAVALDCRQWNARALPALMVLARRFRPDVIHCHKSADLFACRVAAALCGAALVYHEHAGRRRYTPLRFMAYGGIDIALAVSRVVMEWCRVNLPLPPERIRLVYNGIDLSKFRKLASPEVRRACKRRWGFADDSLVVCSIGRMTAGKGQHLLLDALSRAARRMEKSGVRLRCLLAGGLTPELGADPSYVESLRRFVGEHGMERDVCFAGYVARIEEVLAAADIFVHASEWESFGLAVVEAMAAGVPVIALDAGAISEIVEDGKTGLLLNSCSSLELADSLVHLASSRS